MISTKVSSRSTRKSCSTSFGRIARSIATSSCEKHRDIFLKACDGYRAKAIEVLDAMLTEAKANRRIRQSTELVEPIDHTTDYDRVIRMLEMSQADNIKINESQFRSYVLDEWNWMGQFVGSTARYLGR